MKDDDGVPVHRGDWISFSYGIPPVGVRARLVERQGDLVAVTLGNHKPKEMKLSRLRHYVGSWFKADPPA